MPIFSSKRLKDSSKKIYSCLMLLPAPNQSENIENNECFFKFYTLTNDSRFFVQHKVLNAPYR